MRITVNLSQFFHDHRCLAKIFVNNKMKCIRDVEEHINGIFKIENFYLKCGNEYLPPTEDVRILNNDDIVWAVPESTGVEYYNYNMIEVFPQEQKIPEQEKKIPEQENIVLKMKKKKKRLHANIQQDNFEYEVRPKKIKRHESSDKEVEENTPKIEKKNKKKKKMKHVDVSKDVSFAPMEGTEEERKLEDIPDAIPKDSGRDSLDSSKSTETPESKNSSVKSLVDEFEKKKTSVTKQLNELEIEPERRVNIVKTIIISNTSTPSSSSKHVKPCEEQKTNNDDSIHVNGVSKSDSVDENESLSNVDSSSVCLSNVEFDTNVNKRRRRRTRKRKSGVKTTSEIVTTFEQPVYNYIHKPLIVQTQTPTHLRFSEEQSFSKKVDVTTESTVSTVDTKKPTDEVLVNETPKRESEKVDVIRASTEKKVTAVYCDKELEDCILKQPVIHSEPRVGDVIAFKILRLCEDYTPQVSKPIVGKVINYNCEIKEVTFDIVYGREQCVPFQGKFSLEQEESHVIETNQFKFLWSDLFEPRLIYP